MKPYDPNAKCPKCGWDEISSSWIPADKCWTAEPRRWEGNQTREAHISRTCRRCHYRWPEAPLDAEIAEGKQAVTGKLVDRDAWIVSHWINKDGQTELAEGRKTRTKKATKKRKAK